MTLRIIKLHQSLEDYIRKCPEERKYIIDKMLEVSKMMGEKDSENKRFVLVMEGLGLVAFGLAIVGLSAVLGGNTNIETNDTED